MISMFCNAKTIFCHKNISMHLNIMYINIFVHELNEIMYQTDILTCNNLSLADNGVVSIHW